MKSPEESVEDFKGIVNKVLDNEHQANERRGVFTRSSMGHVVHFAHLGFVHVAPKGARPDVIGHGSEDRWGIYLPASFNWHAGHIALIARATKNNSLLRRWEFQSPLSTGIPTEREVTDPEELEDAAEWARSPHLYPEHLAQLGNLTAEEASKVEDAFDKEADKARQTYADLDGLARSRQSNWWKRGKERIN